MILFILSAIGMALLSLVGKRPADLGVSNGSLAPIPDSPNAVSTQSGKPSQRMPAIAMNDIPGGEMMQQIKTIVATLPRTKVVDATKNYLHVEFRSLIFRFTDDVEFYVGESNNNVDFRSASRVGYYDLGVNNRRMQRVTRMLEQAKIRH